MLSLTTCIELATVIDNYVSKVVDRIYTVFDLEHMVHPTLGKFTRDDKINILIKKMKHPPPQGPFTDSFVMDLLQYMINHFYRYEDEPKRSSFIIQETYDHIVYDDRFSYKHNVLANSLKRDGYVIKGRTIKKLLPEEIEESKKESELFSLLNKFNLSTGKGHLQQAISNHSQGNWAGANSQFRSFIESILIEISNQVATSNKCNSAATAISILSKTVNPPFLRADLNEIESNNCNKPFIEGFWKRLHPQGSHPGLSDEEDSTFRYHISIVVAHYLLKRLEQYN